MSMDVTFHIPDVIADRLASGGGDLPRRALEGLALEEYKSGQLTEPELLVLLSFETRYELDGFLKTHGVYEDFTLEDFERDLSDLRSAGF